MSSRVAAYAAAAFLVVCILAGGSRQGESANALLQIAGAGILCWTVAFPGGTQWEIPRALRWILAGFLALALLQLVPLPAGLWTSLPGRELVHSGFQALGAGAPALPLSLDPSATTGVLLTLLAPAAMFALVQRTEASRQHLLVAGLLAATLASVGLGLLQFGGERFYLYRSTNIGVATGFFANANHMGALLVAAAPFAAALFAVWLKGARTPADRLVAYAAGGGMGAVLAVGIFINVSLAVLLMGAPVILLSALLVAQAGKVTRKWTGLLAGAALVSVAVAFAAAATVELPDSARTSIEQRTAIWERTVTAIETHGLAGTGLGTFDQVYPLTEDPQRIERLSVNHAHNDYLELLLELGLPGALLMLAFLGWWALRAARVWSEPEPAPFAKAATIASAALLVHSAVDFPLRTAALGAVFALCLALMIAPAPVRRSASALGRPARHVRLEQIA
jgi:O-antigen ligase